MEKSLKKAIHNIFLIVLLCICIALGVYYAKVKPVMNTPAKTFEIPVTEKEEFSSGEIIEQNFKVENQGFRGFEINLEKMNKDNADFVTISIYKNESNEAILKYAIDLTEYADKPIQILFDKNTALPSTGEYTLKLETRGNILVPYSSDFHQEGWDLKINNVEQSDTLSITILNERGRFLVFLFVFIVSVLIFFVATSYILIFYKKIKIENYFLFAMLILGGIYLSSLFAPYSGYDEPAHFDTAYRYSNVLLGKGYKTEDGGYLRRVEDNMAGLTPAKTRIENLEVVAKNIFKFSNDNELEVVSGRAIQESPIVYLPATIGITIARIFNLGRIPLFLLGRLFNLIAFTILTYFSIKKIPYGKTILFSISMLPLLIEQVSSYSYDVIMIGIAFFFISQCLYSANTDRIRNKKELIALYISGILLAPCKMVYILICFFVLIIPKTKFDSIKKYRTFLYSFLLAVLCSYFLFNLQSVLSQVSDTQQLDAFTSVPAYSFLDIIERPTAFIKILFNSFMDTLDSFYLMPFKVLYLVDLPAVIGIGYIALIYFSSLRIETDNRLLRKKDKVLSMMIVIVLILALYVVGFTWTSIGSPIIKGVQGRYLLPVLPMIALLLRGNINILKESVETKVLFSGSVLEAVTIIYIFVSIIS